MTIDRPPQTLLDRVLSFSIRHRWLVMVATFASAALGGYSYTRLPIDAVPDITNVQVQINTTLPGYTPLEAEQRVTFPIETAMSGLPFLDYTRSVSRYALSQVTVVFHDGTDIYFARQLINERIQQAKSKLPPGVEPLMGPITTGLGEIFMFAVENQRGPEAGEAVEYTTTELRTLNDWVIKPQLRNVPGVADVNAIGGYVKQFHVTPHPHQLLAYGVTLRDVMAALAANNSNVGAGYIERNGEQYLIRAPAQVADLDDIRRIVVGHRDGFPVYIEDVAAVLLGPELRNGAATKDGREAVIGTVFMLIGENSRAVAQRVAAKMVEINRSLPPGVVARTVYDRTDLANATIHTVRTNLLEGAALVVMILLLLLGNLRAALITALVIPLSMLFTFSGMVASHVTGNLMSLGAVDFGLIVDGAVIIVENCTRRLAQAQHGAGRVLSPAERHAVVFTATSEVRRATMFGELIIAVVYLPVLTLAGVEGKMFFPMAWTVMMALLGAMILSVTFVPAAVAISFSGRLSERENVIMRLARMLYEPVLAACIRYRVAVALATLLLIISSGLLIRGMGAEFIPSLDEGDVALHALRIPGTSLTQAIEMQHRLEERLKRVPEVASVFAKIGTAEIATDPMPPSVADGFVIMKRRSAWPDPSKPKAALVGEIGAAAAEIPGSLYELTQPIQMRFNELIAGVRSDVAVKIFGDDMDTLQELGAQAEMALERVAGAADVKVEPSSGLPLLTIQLQREALARFGLDVAAVQEVIQIAIGGQKAGEVFEGDRRFDIVVRLPESLRTDLDAIKHVPIAIPRRHGQALHSRSLGHGSEENGSGPPAFVPLSEVATIQTSVGPNMISRENGKRRLVVTANVRDRDLGSFVAEAQRLLPQQVRMPPGYWMAWGGQFEHLISATRRLQVVVPIVLAVIFLLLFATFGTMREAGLVFTGVPLALTGGVFALWLRDIPLSISAGVGFIALSGVAVLNGLVMISFIKNLRSQGATLDDAITQGSLTRLRPVLMTALVASLGFVPMALATGTGAEVQRPLATVVIGGILSSTVLTLLVLPGLYRMFHRDGEIVSQA